MKFGSGGIHGSGMSFGRSSTGSSYYISTGRYYSFEMTAAWMEPVIERPVPPKLAWTKMNTSWDKKRGRK